MKTLVSLPLFDLLERAAQEPYFTSDALTPAYDVFVMRLETLCEKKNSLSHLMLTLCYTRQELLSLQKEILFTCGAKKKFGYGL